MLKFNRIVSPNKILNVSYFSIVKVLGGIAQSKYPSHIGNNSSTCTSNYKQQIIVGNHTIISDAHGY